MTQATAHKTASTDALALAANMELPYLLSLRAELDKLIRTRQDEGIAHARAEIRRIAATAGIDLAALVKGAYEPQREPRVKYRHPETGKSWSGAGRRPHWVAAWLDSGKPIEELAV